MKTQNSEPVIFISLQINNASKKLPKSISIPSIARIFDKEKGYERIIQYTKGQQTIYQDEMKGEPKPLPSKEPIIMYEGALMCNPKEKTLIDYLTKSYIKGNTDLLDGNPIYELQDFKASSEKELETIYEDVNLILAIKNMDVAELEALSMVLGDTKTDTKTTNVIRRDLIVEARRNPKGIKEAMDNPKTQRKAKLLLDINENIIAINKMARLIQWGDGSKLCTVPVGLDAVDYLVDMTFLPDYADIWKAINDKMNPAIAEDKRTFVPAAIETNPDIEFIEKCLAEGALTKKGPGWYSIGGTKKGDDYYGFHHGNPGTLSQYLREHPEVKAILEEKILVK